MPKEIITTWFYSSPKGEKIKYPQIGTNSDDWEFQKHYWNCIVTFFTSAKIQLEKNNNRSYEFILFINEDLPKKYELDLDEFFLKIGVRIVKFKPTHIPNNDKFTEFKSQFVMIDILKIAENFLDDDDLFLILDSDCLFINNIPAESLLELKIKGLQFIKNKWKGKDISNGLTNIKYNEISEILIGKSIKPIEYWAGGEYFGFTKQYLCEFNKVAESLYAKNIGLQEPLLTEEQLFTLIIYKILNGEFSEASNFIRRVWTKEAYRTTDRTIDQNLSILHLPAEKGSGFKKYSELVISGQINSLIHGYDDLKEIFSLD